jgi:hypothetical protein
MKTDDVMNENKEIEKDPRTHSAPLLDDDTFADLMESSFAKHDDAKSLSTDAAMKARVWAKLQESIAREPGGAAASGAPSTPHPAATPAVPVGVSPLETRSTETSSVLVAPHRRTTSFLGKGFVGVLAVAAAAVLFVRLQGPAPAPDSAEILHKGATGGTLSESRLIATSAPAAASPTEGALGEKTFLLQGVPLEASHAALFASVDGGRPTLVGIADIGQATSQDAPTARPLVQAGTQNPLTFSLPTGASNARVCAFIASSRTGADALVDVAPGVFERQPAALCYDAVP